MEKLKKYYHKNGQLHSQGMVKSTYSCTSKGGPLDCHGKGCVECISLLHYNKLGMWKYYYDNGQLKTEGEYTGLDFDVRCGTWKIYDTTGKLSSEIIYEKK